MTKLVNRRPTRSGALFLSALPFIIVIVAYLVASDIRLADNPNDKLLPSFGQIGQTIEQFAAETSRRTGEIQLWADTGASLTRLLTGIAISSALGLLFGIATGAIPYANKTLSPFIAVLSMIPPLAILPILFIVFGLGEVSKITLIAIGIVPFIIRELALRVTEIPREQLIKIQSLGASTWQLIMRAVLPQILPRLLDAIRLSLGPAWLFLIAAEAIAATDGLGYRIFLVRRYLAMDTILPYVAWITLLAFVMDYLLRVTNRKLFPWYQAEAH
jgi:NitT/TauT family transport system permease protein